jgi:hypothetical protein
MTNALGIVTTIGCQSFCTSAGSRSVPRQAYLLEHSFGLGRLVTLAWSETRVQR